MTVHPSFDTELRRRAEEALRRQNGVEAKTLIEDLVRAGDDDVEIWLALVQASLLCGDETRAWEAADNALRVAPRDRRALVARAEGHYRNGDLRSAASFFAAALANLSEADRASPMMRSALARAHAVNQKIQRDLEDYVRNRLEAQGVSPEQVSPRFAQAIDILFRRKQAYVQQPHFLYFPELANIQFFPRESFHWLARLEAATHAIRTELQQLIGPGFSPYVEQHRDRADRDLENLAENQDWTALYLVRDGVRQPEAERCPAVMEAIAVAPLCTIPRRAPFVLFSKLAAGARIPPHSGMLNTRIICHLPLIVPDGCVFRVGNEERTWREGQAWIFDDTIEHEAFNRSSQDRYILIFDIWRPDLSEEERVSIASLIGAVDVFGGASPSWGV